MNVCSAIRYDNGEHLIIKNDIFSNVLLPIHMSQTREYYYRNIYNVTVLLSGSYNGETLNSTGSTMYP